MKQKNWSGGYFKKICITMSVATFSVLLVALIAFQFEFSHATTGYLNAVNTKFLKNAAESVTFRLETVRRDALGAYSSYYGTVLMSANEPSAVNMVSALNEIDNKLSQNKTLYSVYFYNSATEKISVFGAHRSYLAADEFELITNDKDILPLLTKGEKLPPMQRNITSPTATEKELSVITQIFWTPATNGKNNAVVINTLPDELFGILKSTDASYSEPQNNFLVYSPRGDLLFDGLSQAPLTDLSSSELLAAVNENEGKSIFRKTVNGVPYYFNVYKDEAERVFVNIVAKSDLAASFSYSPIVYTAILVGAFILGLTLIILLSRKLYMPIAKLSKSLSSRGAGLENVTARSEIDFIAQSFDITNVKLDSLFEYKERTLSLSQISFLQDQLLRNRYSAKTFWAACKTKELPYAPGDRFVPVVAGFCESAPKPDSHMLHYAIANVFLELTEGICDVHQILLSGNESIFFCCFKGEHYSQLHDVLCDIQKAFHKYFGLPVSFFAADPVLDPELLCETATALQELCAYRYFYEDGCILKAEDSGKNERKTELCPLFDFAPFEDAVRGGDVSDACGITDAYFAQLTAHSFEAAKASVSLFAAKYISMLHTIEKQLLTKFELDYHGLYTGLTTAQRLCDASALTQKTISFVCECVNDEGDDTMQALAGKIVDYIGKNYADFNLSSKAIAMQHHISVPTLNRIFKKKTGDSVANYVKKLRLSKSIELLVKTNLPVEVLASDVGFENTKYFYTLFKSEYGISPTSYRITNSVQELSD